MNLQLEKMKMVILSNSSVFSVIPTQTPWWDSKLGEEASCRKKSTLNILHKSWERISENIWNVLQLDFILISS